MDAKTRNLALLTALSLFCALYRLGGGSRRFLARSFLRSVASPLSR